MMEYKDQKMTDQQQSSTYSEYIANQIDRDISYIEYLSGIYDNDNKNIKRKEKIKNLFN